jgi:hypothetical protein
MPLSTISQ